MAMIKPLPQLQIRLPIVTMTGEPTTTFHRYFNTEFGGAIYRNQVQLEGAILDIQAALAAAAAAQAAAAAAQAVADTAQTTADTAQATAATAQTTADDAITLAEGITDGSTLITALNVAGTDVAPFLGKTDGSKLVDATGLDDGVVETPAIAVQAVTKAAPNLIAGPTSVLSTTPVEINSVTVTVEDGDRVDLLLVFALVHAGGGAPGDIGTTAAISSVRLLRDSTTLIEGYATAVVKRVSQISSVSIAFSDEPAAGTYDYSGVSFVSTTTDVALIEARNIYLSPTVVKR